MTAEMPCVFASSGNEAGIACYQHPGHAPLLIAKVLGALRATEPGIEAFEGYDVTNRRSRDSAESIRFFATPARWRQWLEQNHATATELWVGFHKTASSKRSITWPESVDEALCFGWIDGVRKSIDATSYRIRFTPRKKGSNWSTVNVRRVEVLTKEGRMHAAGLAAFAARDPGKSGVYSFEQRQAATLGAELERRFRANAEAWAFFESQPPYYRRTAIFWVVSAKQEATRERRLGALIEDSAAGRRVGPLRRPGE